MKISYRISLLALLIAQLIFLGRIIFLGEVVYPHANDVELHAHTAGDSSLIDNRKFSDHSSAYIPEIELHLNGNPKSWLSTWNPHNQMGRPAIHLSGFSKAYLLSHVIALFLKEPLAFYSVLTALTVFLTGIFCFLFLKEIDLHPVACFTASLGLSCGVLPSYWLTFVMFISPICWMLCLMWLMASYFRRSSFLKGVGIAFACYSLLMTAYPQNIVGVFYILAIQFLITVRDSRNAFSTTFKIGIQIPGFLALGALSALPVYADLAITAARSARMNTDHNFFLAVLPEIHGAGDILRFFALWYDAFWFGNPIKPDYPFEFNGISLTPLYFSLIAVTLAEGLWRRLWPWQLFVMACFLCSVSKPCFLFLVDYMGFCFSRYLPLAFGVAPAFIVAAHGADHLVRHGVTNRLLALVLIIVPLVLMGIVSINDEAAISICHIASSLFIVAVILVSMFIPKFTITALFY